MQRGDRVVVIDEMNDYYDVSLKEDRLKVLCALEKQLQSSPDERLLSFHKASVEDDASIFAIFEQEQPDLVCHLAARAGVRNSIDCPLLYCDANLRGTLVLLEAVRKHPKIRNFVYASSSSVYGARPDGDLEAGFKETDNVDHPVSPYAATKRCCELIAWNYAHLHQLPCIGLRFFTVYGPRGRPDMALYKFVANIYRGLPIQQYGDGQSSRDYTFVDDIVAGILGALGVHDELPRKASHEVYNLGKGDSTSLSQFIALIQEAMGKQATIEILPDQAGDVPFTLANVEKAKAAFGYNPKTPPSVGIPIFVEWYKSYMAKKQITSS